MSVFNKLFNFPVNRVNFFIIMVLYAILRFIVILVLSIINISTSNEPFISALRAFSQFIFVPSCTMFTVAFLYISVARVKSIDLKWGKVFFYVLIGVSLIPLLLFFFRDEYILEGGNYPVALKYVDTYKALNKILGFNMYIIDVILTLLLLIPKTRKI